MPNVVLEAAVVYCVVVKINSLWSAPYCGLLRATQRGILFCCEWLLGLWRDKRGRQKIVAQVAVTHFFRTSRKGFEGFKREGFKAQNAP